MSKKNLLNESTIRKFMKLASIEPLASDFLGRLQESEEELEEGQPVRRAPKLITMDQYRKMTPEEQEMINPEDVLGYVGPDGEDAYGNKPPPSRR